MRKLKCFCGAVLGSLLLTAPASATESEGTGRIFFDNQFLVNESIVVTDTDAAVVTLPAYDSEYEVGGQKYVYYNSTLGWLTGTATNSKPAVYYWGSEKMFQQLGVDYAHTYDSIVQVVPPHYASGEGMSGRIDFVLSGYLKAVFTYGSSSDEPSLSDYSFSINPHYSNATCTATVTHQSGAKYTTPVTLNVWDTGLGSNYNISTFYSPLGFTLSGSYRADDSDPVLSIVINCDNLAFESFVDYMGSGSGISYRVSMERDLIVTSFRQLYGSVADYEDTLDNIADILAESNSLSQAYYGDILAICRQILEKADDIDTVSQQLLGYVSQLSAYLDSIDSTTTDIYDAIEKYFEQVLQTIDENGDKISNTINSAEKQLEEYLKPLIDYITSLQETTGESSDTLPQHKADVDSAQSDNAGLDELDTVALGEAVTQLQSFQLFQTYFIMTIGLALFCIFVKKGMS